LLGVIAEEPLGLVDDPQRGCRVRVKVVLDKVNMDEIPDSYRESNASR
jgi:hypothetical protein